MVGEQCPCGHAGITWRAYPWTVGEQLDRRTRKKAATRELIRGVAHRLFDERGFDAVTIADVARSSDVAVQTVFNHFASKEELFFDGRGPQIDAPSEAIRSRGAGVPPLTALRDFLVGLARTQLSALAEEQRRRYMRTLLDSDTLRAYERELLIEAERRLAATLTEALREGDATRLPIPADPVTSAAVVAAMWCSAVRVLIHSNRERLTSGAFPEDLAGEVEGLVADLLTQLESDASMMVGPPTTPDVSLSGAPDQHDRASTPRELNPAWLL